MKDYYSILGIRRNANELEIKEAYRQKARIYHPDRNQHPNAQAQFQEINEAHKVLSDPAKRRIYDLKSQAGIDLEDDVPEIGCCNFGQIFREIFLSIYKEKKAAANSSKTKSSELYRPSKYTNRPNYPPTNLNNTRPSSVYYIPRDTTDFPIRINRPTSYNPQNYQAKNDSFQPGLYRQPRARHSVPHNKRSNSAEAKHSKLYANLRPLPKVNYNENRPDSYYQTRYLRSFGPHSFPDYSIQSTSLIDICIVSKQFSSKLLMVNINDSIATIKMEIEDRMGIPVDRQRLEFGENVLHDKQLLRDIIPGVGSTLVLSVI